LFIDEVRFNKFKKIDSNKYKELMSENSDYQKLINTFPAKTLEHAKQKDYKFWSTQPVPNLNEHIGINGPIEENKEYNLVEPVKLPDGFKWVTYDMSSEQYCKKVSAFLNRHYIEDVTKSFKLKYSAKFLQWYFTVPGAIQDLCIGIEFEKTGTLIGFISGIPLKHKINDKTVDTVEINFLCVHMKFRNKRCAPALIKEITRISRLNGYHQAFYSAENYLPKPFARVTYFHRAINIKKLLKTKFITKQGHSNTKEMIKYYSIPNEPINKDFVKMEEPHIADAYNIFNLYLDRYNFYPIYTLEQFKHVFYDNNFVTTYVLKENDIVVDFISYYKLPSIAQKKNITINGAYLFYYTSDTETAYRLLRDMLVVAKKEKMDVFNALNIMENENILREIEFVEGTGILNYYFFNWKCRDLTNNQICKTII